MFRLDDNFVFCCNFIFLGWSQPRKIIITKKNEVAHPTETPLYLWYDAFMPTIYLLVKNFWKKGGTTKTLLGLNFISSQVENCTNIIRKIVDLITFFDKIQEKNRKGFLQVANWSSISPEKIRENCIRDRQFRFIRKSYDIYPAFCSQLGVWHTRYSKIFEKLVIT